MFMDEETKKSLDFQYIWNKIDIKTPYGKIYKDKAKTYKIGEEDQLIEELEKVETYLNYAKNKEIMRKLDNVFAHIKDLRSSIKRARSGGILTEVELFEIKGFVHMVGELESILKDYNILLWDDMKIYPMKDLEKLLDPEETGISTFYIYDSYSEELKKIRKDKKELEKEIKKNQKVLKDSIKEELGIKLKPDGTINISKNNSELIEKIKDNPNLAYNSETYMNIKYSLKPTEEMNLLERSHLILKDREEREESRIKEILSKKIGEKSKSLFKNISSIGKIDFILGKAKFGMEIDGVRPKIIKDHSINIVEGRHIKVEESLKSKGLNFTPISVRLNQGTTCITGANMGGKTISLKLVGLLTAMAQYGLMVPAKRMTLGLNGFIKTSIGDLQSTDQGLSTFGGEIKRIQESIEKSDHQGLILIDELARGTNPKEGYAISKAIVDYLKDRNSITLLTTHYDNIASGEDINHLQVIGLSHIDFEELYKELQISNKDKMDIINNYMDYRLKKVEKMIKVPQEALNIARVMGLDRQVIELAEKNLTRS